MLHLSVKQTAGGAGREAAEEYNSRNMTWGVSKASAFLFEKGLVKSPLTYEFHCGLMELLHVLRNPTSRISCSGCIVHPNQ